MALMGHVTRGLLQRRSPMKTFHPIRISLISGVLVIAFQPGLLAQAPSKSAEDRRYDCKAANTGEKQDRDSPCYDFEPVRRLIERKLKENAVPSMAVAVAKNGRILWEEGFGSADREKGVKASEQTLYSLASLTKPFTATGIMQLVEAHKIDLDAPIDRYMAPVALTYHGEWNKATVREVLSHTAGLPTFYHFHYQDDDDPMVSMQETIRRYGIVVHQPGKIWEYSNLGYGILDYVTAQVSGLAWEDYLRDRIFLPLGLKQTTPGMTQETQLFLAPRYDDETHRRLPPFDFDHRGASAIYSSVDDVVQFGMFYLKDRIPGQHSILSDAAIEEMKRPANAEAVSGSQYKTLYGLGWQIESEHGFQTFGHEGAMVGSTTILKLFPSEDLAIAVLTNTFNESAVIDVEQQIAAALLPKYAAALHSETSPKPSSSTPKFPDSLFGHWTGTVEMWPRTNISIALECKPDGDIHVRLGDQLESVLNEVRYRDGNLVGRFAGNLPTNDAMHHPHTVVLNVWLEKNKLRGEASAITWDTELNYFDLPSYVELSKTGEKN